MFFTFVVCLPAVLANSRCHGYREKLAAVTLNDQLGAKLYQSCGAVSEQSVKPSLR